MVTSISEEEPAASAVPAAATEDERPRRWHLRAGAVAGAVIAATALVHGLGGRGALVTGGIIGAAALLGLVIWRLPHLRRHFARPRGIRPWRSNRTQPWQAKRGGLLPSLRRSGRAGGTGPHPGAGRTAGARRGAPAAAQRPAQRGIRGRLPSWMPGSSRRRGSGSSRGGVTATRGKPAGKLARLVPAPVRKAFRAVHKPGSVAAQRKAAAAKTAARGKTADRKPGHKPAAPVGIRKRPAKRGAKCARCGEPATSEVTWADGHNHGTELLCDECWDKGTKAARAAKGLNEGTEPAPEPERQPGPAIEPDKTAAPTARGKKMSAAAVDAATEAISETLGSYQPESGTDLDQFLAGLPNLFESLGSAFSGVAERLGSEFPVHPAVAEHLQEIAATVAGMGEFAAEAHSIHRVAHAAEMERIENPRPQEEIWDVTQQ